jgi:hypothetical protein
MSCPVSRTITPNSLPALGKLCTYCENLDFRDLFESESREYQHHESLDDLFKSATSGCGICQLFRYSSEVDPRESYDKVKARGRILVAFSLPSNFVVRGRSKVEEAPRFGPRGNLFCNIDILDPKCGEC